MAEYQPITDLPDNWTELASAKLVDLRRLWAKEGQQIESTDAYKAFMERLVRQVSIETGIIERLYTIDRGITQLLIERGIDEALIPHDSTGGRHPEEIAAMIQDHQRAVEGLFQFVKGERGLSLSYIRELHQVLTDNQQDTIAKDQFGKLIRVPLLKGDWKKSPNNPTRPDGTVHAYCPPEQVPIQMEQLVEWYHQHTNLDVPPEVEAAWLHHRFTQIHPFQDGNGRVARMLASLVFIRAGGFPLAITNDDRGGYIDALEAADQGDLAPLVDLFSMVQGESYQQALIAAREVLELEPKIDEIIGETASSIKGKRDRQCDEIQLKLKQRVSELMELTKEKFQAIADKINETGEVKSIHVGKSDWRKNIRGHYAERLISRRFQGDYLIDQDTESISVVFEISDEFSDHRIFVSGALVKQDVGWEVGINSTYQCMKPKIKPIERLSDNLFTFSYDDRFATVRIDYQHWLNTVIEAGLEKWREHAGGTS